MISTFSIRLRELRLATGISQAELGLVLGLSKQSINEMEHGRSNTTLDRAVSIAEFFKVSLDYLVGRTDTPEIH